MLRSAEADLYPRRRPDLADEIDGAIGEGSQFFVTFGFYAHGVGPDTAVAPRGWEKRLVKFRSRNTGDAVGWCMEPHDLVLSKAARASKKDFDYLEAALSSGIVKVEVLRQRLTALDVDAEVVALIEARIDAFAKGTDTRT